MHEGSPGHRHECEPGAIGCACDGPLRTGADRSSGLPVQMSPLRGSGLRRYVLEGVVEVGDEIVDVLAADRHAHQAVGDARSEAMVT